MIERVKLRRRLPSPDVPLLVTELAEDFERLRDDLEQDIKPRGAIEQIYMQDVAHVRDELGEGDRRADECSLRI